MPFSRWSARRALSLLEVVAALALTGTLLSSLLVAHGRLTQQQRRAELRLAALTAADELLQSWTLVEPMVIPAREGTVLTNDRLRWRVRELPATTTVPGTQVVRLEMWEVPQYDRFASTSASPLANIEFLSTAPIPASEIMP